MMDRIKEILKRVKGQVNYTDLVGRGAPHVEEIPEAPPDPEQGPPTVPEEDRAKFEELRKN